MRVGVKILGSNFWFLFFLITIALIGFAFNAALFFPVLALSKVFPALKPVPDRIIYIGIYFLMMVQPWFNSEIEIELPKNHKGGVLLVSNHRSHLDVFILLSRIQGIRVLAKSTLFKIPFLALMMRSTRQIGVERGRFDAWVKAMDTVKERLRAGERVHVFPEMTRCAPGFRGVQPFTAGPFLAALQEDAVILPLVFKNTDGVWPKGQVGLNFRQPVQVRTLAPIRARDFASADLLKTEVHRQIEQALL
jgi:1-acyl-sn-glycerol-3-phosphate acyltransferase